ncbi:MULTISPECIES: DNA repair protein [Micromonospora]|nr:MULTISPECIES: DNA repair protein [Micromonospora]
MQPNDRYQQHGVCFWGTAEATGLFPAQPRYREIRCGRGVEGRLSWSELDTLPAGSSARRGLTAH